MVLRCITVYKFNLSERNILFTDFSRCVMIRKYQDNIIKRNGMREMLFFLIGGVVIIAVIVAVVASVAGAVAGVVDEDTED